MSYFTREDLPYYYTLYDNFAVGDQYFQSSFTQTTPNRLHLFSGSNGLSVGEEAILHNVDSTKFGGWNWTTMGEILEDAGVSWQVYQEADNFNDNGYAWHRSFQEAAPNSSLYARGMFRFGSALGAFSEAVKTDTLPQVSYIIAPQVKSEHATAHPCEGEDWTAQILEALRSNMDVYAKTVFILNYDEGGQFFDHSLTYTPPVPDERQEQQPGRQVREVKGKSTVTTLGEITTLYPTTSPEPEWFAAALVASSFLVAFLAVAASKHCCRRRYAKLPLASKGDDMEKSTSDGHHGEEEEQYQSSSSSSSSSSSGPWGVEDTTKYCYNNFRIEALLVFLF